MWLSGFSTAASAARDARFVVASAPSNVVCVIAPWRPDGVSVIGVTSKLGLPVRMTRSEISVAPTIVMSANAFPCFSTPRSSPDERVELEILGVHREAHEARVAAVTPHEGAQLRRVGLGIGRAEGGADTKRAGLGRGEHRELAQRRDGAAISSFRIA